MKMCCSKSDFHNKKFYIYGQFDGWVNSAYDAKNASLPKMPYIFFLCLPMALSNCCAFISSFDIGALGLTFRLFLGFIVELLQDIFGICWLMLSGLERSRDPFNSNLVGVFKRGILVKCGPAYLEKKIEWKNLHIKENIRWYIFWIPAMQCPRYHNIRAAPRGMQSNNSYPKNSFTAPLLITTSSLFKSPLLGVFFE